MSQSTFIAGALIAGFVLFLAARNRLSTYAAVLWGSTGAQVPATQAQSVGGSIAEQGQLPGGGNIGQDFNSAAALATLFAL